jgi:hypothetical protein
MLENLLDPVVLFFLAGLIAGILKSDLRLPESIYEILSIYLLLAIGLKGGVQLAESDLGSVTVPTLGAIALGVVIPFIAYFILRTLGKFNRADSAAIAAHYGSVSAVTFAVVLSFLTQIGVWYEEYVTVLLVMLEIPAIAIGIFIARTKATNRPLRVGLLMHEVFLGKSLYLLVVGLIVGYVLGPSGMEPVRLVFVDLFRGALAFFLLEMGLVASNRLVDLKRAGAFLVGFGILMPLLSGVLGCAMGVLTGLSVGGTAVLATLAGSASYIAAPAAMRVAVPEANPTLYVTASLGITFPFNLVVGIPVYYQMAGVFHSFMG